MPPPPCDEEAEQAVLGAILLRPSVLDQVSPILQVEDFYRTGHCIIFQAMRDLAGEGKPVDLVTVTERIRNRNQLEEVGGPVFLAELSEHVGTAANAHHYARSVWEKSQIRKVHAKVVQILRENPNGNLEEFLTWTQSQIFEVTEPALSRISSNRFPPLSSSTIPLVSDYLKIEPPPREYLFEGVLPAGIVGGLVAVGGTGKGNLIINLGLSLATGQKAGPLKPARKFKVLYVVDEDHQDELHRRVHAAGRVLWPDGSPPPEANNFIPISVMGKNLGPLMQLDATGNPANAPAFDWLSRTLENLQDVEVLIIDPKSKFYGLVENDNAHNAAWINCLESLIARFKITILFSHHESKARAGSMDQASSRGGSALTDGCRWVANIKTMDPKTAEKFQVADPHNYVVMDVTKSNYAAKLPAPIYFRRGAGGALTHVELGFALCVNVGETPR
jgi:hypothetical protein